MSQINRGLNITLTLPLQIISEQLKVGLQRDYLFCSKLADLPGRLDFELTLN